MSSTNPPVNIDYEKLAKTVLLALKNISAKGAPLSLNNVAKSLSAQPGLGELLVGRSGDSETENSTEQGKAYHQLYQEEKEKAAETKDLMARSILTVLRLTKIPDQPELAKALSGLKQAVSGGAESQTVEKAMQRIKSEIVNIEMAAGESEANIKSTALTKNGEVSSTELLAKVRSSYLELLGEIDLELDDDYRDKVASVRAQIAHIQDWQSFFALRPRMEALVRRYSGQIFEERKKAADFTTQVAKRITELEKLLASSFEKWSDFHQANDEFNANLEQELNGTADCIKNSQQLEDMKDLVLKKLNGISEAVKLKRVHDTSAMNETKSKVTGVKQKFGGLQEEIKKVQNENRFLIKKLKHDVLTGAFNRFAYEEQLAAEISRMNRYKRPCSVILFDLDFFKDVNDNFGHVIGDKCLKETVRNIKSDLRSNDMLARYGGDEFIILLPETDSERGAEVAEKLRKTIANIDFMVRGKKVPLTITCGVTEIRETDVDGEVVFNRADKALYEAKRAGRNRVSLL